MQVRNGYENDRMEELSMEESSQGATEYLLILAAVLGVVSVAIYFVFFAGEYPPVGSKPVIHENDIAIMVSYGSIPAGSWDYKLEAEDETGQTDDFGNGLSAHNAGKWQEGTKKLKATWITLLSDAKADNYWVYLRHAPSKHIYYAGKKLTKT